MYYRHVVRQRNGVHRWVALDDLALAEPFGDLGTPRHATPHHTTPRHAMPRYAMPWHTTAMAAEAHFVLIDGATGMTEADAERSNSTVLGAWVFAAWG